MEFSLAYVDVGLLESSYKDPHSRLVVEFFEELLIFGHRQVDRVYFRVLFVVPECEPSFRLCGIVVVVRVEEHV